MDCSQAFSVEKNQQRRSLTERLCWFFIKLMHRFSSFYSEKTNGSPHQVVSCCAYKKGHTTYYVFLLRSCRLLPLLFLVALSNNPLTIHRKNPLLAAFPAFSRLASNVSPCKTVRLMKGHL